tara:strand:+ start:820 stop:1029 length:210 start_codon:yes stop_codon:yes gene_type:complete
VTDILDQSVYERTERIAEALLKALDLEGLETAQDADGRALLLPHEYSPDEVVYHCIDRMAREIERQVFE